MVDSIPPGEFGLGGVAAKLSPEILEGPRRTFAHRRQGADGAQGVKSVGDLRDLVQARSDLGAEPFEEAQGRALEPRVGELPQQGRQRQRAVDRHWVEPHRQPPGPIGVGRADRTVELLSKLMLGEGLPGHERMFANALAGVQLLALFATLPYGGARSGVAPPQSDLSCG